MESMHKAIVTASTSKLANEVHFSTESINESGMSNFSHFIENVQEPISEESKPPLDTGLSTANLLDLLVPQESDNELDNDSLHEELLQSPPPEIAFSRPLSRNELRDYDDYELGMLVPLSKYSSQMIWDDRSMSRLNLATPNALSEDELDRDDHDSTQNTGSGVLSKASSKSIQFKSIDELNEETKKQELMQQLQDALERQEKARQINALLQHRLADYYRRKQQSEDNKESISDKAPTSEQEQRYSSLLHVMMELRSEYNSIQQANQTVDDEYKAKVAEKKVEAELKAKEYFKFKRQIGLQSENSRTGKPIPKSVLDQLDALESRKDGELIEVRLENMRLKSRLKRQEQILKQKEELAEGLHLIDFEQLKIENQTYGEKIEEKNEELSRLRRKMSNVVQILAHIKQKLFYEQKENSFLKSKLSGLDQKVQHYRDVLPSKKHHLSQLRNKNVELKEESGLTGYESLLRDYEEKYDGCQIMEKKIQKIQEEYQRINYEMTQMHRRYEKNVKTS